MKYSKLISKCFTHKSNTGHVLVAVAAGLAVGAVFSILFAPASGADTRGAISSKAKGISDGAKDKYTALRNKIMGVVEEVEAAEAEVPHFKHTPVKKRKSDIKDIVSEAHHAEHPDESNA